MDDINEVRLRGRLVRDPEVRYTPNGAMVTNFTVATGRELVVDGKHLEGTDYHWCVAWTKLAEVVSRLSKGSPVLVTGRLQTRSWEDTSGRKRYRTEVIASSVEPLELRTPAGSM